MKHIIMLSFVTGLMLAAPNCNHKRDAHADIFSSSVARADEPVDAGRSKVDRDAAVDKDGCKCPCCKTHVKKEHKAPAKKEAPVGNKQHR